MRKSWLSYFLIACPFFLKAQIRYEDLDKYSKAIREILYKSQPYYYFNGSKFTFPIENFTAFFSTGLVSCATYSKEKDRKSEVLYVTEELDFSKATKIFCQKEEGGGSDCIVVQFSGPFKTLMIEGDDNSTTTYRDSGVSFVYQKDKPNDKKLLFNYLSELILLFKKDKDPENATKFENEYKAWKEAERKNSPKAYKDFIKNNPGSLFDIEAEARMEK